MMKKKTKEQEEINDKTVNKPTENKEFSQETDNITGKAQENSASDGTDGSDASTANKGAVTDDKVVTDVNIAEEKLAEMQDKYSAFQQNLTTTGEEHCVRKWNCQNMPQKIFSGKSYR